MPQESPPKPDPIGPERAPGEGNPGGPGRAAGGPGANGGGPGANGGGPGANGGGPGRSAGGLSASGGGPGHGPGLGGPEHHPIGPRRDPGGDNPSGGSPGGPRRASGPGGPGHDPIGPGRGPGGFGPGGLGRGAGRGGLGPVLVVGGGVGGLGVALALTAAGCDVAVYEAHPWSGEDIGAFLTLASNGMRALAAFGAAEAVAAVGFELTELRVLDASGAEAGLVPLAGHEHPLTRYRCLRRAELCAALHAEAVRRGVPVRHGARLTAVAEDPDGVTATFADGTTARGALLVAADGLHSVTRTLLDPEAAAPRYAGQRVYYGYTTAAAQESRPRITMVRGGAAFGFAVSPAGETYWFARVSGDEPAPGERDDLLALLRPDATPAAEIVAATAGPMMTVARDLPAVARWRTPRTLLIGDAAHAASPATGQGASMALEDAVVLAKALRDRATLAEALDTYEHLRRPRVDHNIAVSARLTAGRTAQPAQRPSFPREDENVVRLLDWHTPL